MAAVAQRQQCGDGCRGWHESATPLFTQLRSYLPNAGEAEGAKRVLWGVLGPVADAVHQVFKRLAAMKVGVAAGGLFGRLHAFGYVVCLGGGSQVVTGRGRLLQVPHSNHCRPAPTIPCPFLSRRPLEFRLAVVVRCCWLG